MTADYEFEPTHVWKQPTRDGFRLVPVRVVSTSSGPGLLRVMDRARKLSIAYSRELSPVKLAATV